MPESNYNEEAMLRGLLRTIFFYYDAKNVTRNIDLA